MYITYSNILISLEVNILSHESCKIKRAAQHNRTAPYLMPLTGTFFSFYGFATSTKLLPFFPLSNESLNAKIATLYIHDFPDKKV